MTDENNRSKDGRDATTSASAVVESEPKDAGPSKPATEADLDKVKQQMSGFERSNLRWTRASFFIILATAVFIGLQWNEMRIGGSDTHDLAKATEDASGAASDQADAAQQFSDTAEDINERMSDAVDQLAVAADSAKNSIRATQNAMRLDQRAWVVWKGIGGVPQLDKQWVIETYFTNSGKTPAKNVKASCFLETNKGESEIDFNKVSITKTTPTIIAPNDPSTYCVLHPLTTVAEKVTQDILDNFARKEITPIVFGSLTYKDIFGTEHWLTFCHAMEPNGITWDACTVYNDTGDGKKPKWKQQKPN